MIDKYRADLHIHTLLSPCADLKMTPANIVKKAKEEGLQIIGITDHNSTRNSKLVKQIGEREEVFVLTGAEVTTKEEVHCLAFFEEDKQLDKFQEFIDEHITIIPNKEDYFGYQPVVDENDNILEMVLHYLPAALNVGITEIQKAVEKLDGIFIPAHVDKPSNGIFSQLGYVPDNLSFDAFGISKNSTENEVRKHYVLDDNISLICNSDAHYLQQIGEAYTVFNIEEICFREIKMALNNRCKRFVETL
jgi:PHP family Zn ribbon phosphoesterase